MAGAIVSREVSEAPSSCQALVMTGRNLLCRRCHGARHRDLGAGLTTIQNERPVIAIRFLGPSSYSGADLSDSFADMPD